MASGLYVYIILIQSTALSRLKIKLNNLNHTASFSISNTFNHSCPIVFGSYYAHFLRRNVEGYYT